MTLDDFYQLVLHEAPGCPEPLLDQSIRLAARQFLSATLSWRQVLAAVPLVDGLSEYAMTPPAGAEVVSALTVWCGTRRLDPATPDDIARFISGAETSVEPSFFNLEAAYGNLKVYPTPALPTTSLVVEVALTVPRDATTLPDILGGDPFEGVAAGAAARLLGMPEWVNPLRAAELRGLFNGAVDDELDRQLRGGVRASLAIVPRAFG